MRKLFLITLTLTFVFCFRNIGQAQTVTLSANSVTVNANADDIRFSRAQFHLANLNTSIFARLREGYVGASPCGCFAGTTLNLKSQFGGESSIQGGNLGLVDGNLYERIFFSGNLTFDGGNYVLPTTYSRQRFTVTLPATLTGRLNGHKENQLSSPSPPFFTSQLNMQGTVSVTLQVNAIAINPNGRDLTKIPHYIIHRIKYNFANTTREILKNEEAQ